MVDFKQLKECSKELKMLSSDIEQAINDYKLKRLDDNDFYAELDYIVRALDEISDNIKDEI